MPHALSETSWTGPLFISYHEFTTIISQLTTSTIVAVTIGQMRVRSVSVEPTTILLLETVVNQNFNCVCD